MDIRGINDKIFDSAFKAADRAKVWTMDNKHCWLVRNTKPLGEKLSKKLWEVIFFKNKGSGPQTVGFVVGKEDKQINPAFKYGMTATMSFTEASQLFETL